jgi:putative FmdB family regulatory protein
MIKLPPPEGGGNSVEHIMPTYEYRCKSCKSVLEIFHSISTSIRKCPKCGGTLERLITPNAGLIFKGSGFYHTDYKLKSNGNGNGDRKKKKVSEDKKTEKKETKKDNTKKK